MIDFCIHDRIGLLTISAEGRNALSADDLRSLASIVEEQTELITIDGLILRGAGDAFSSGLMLDTNDGAPSKQEQFAILRPLLNRALLALSSAPYPVVAAVTGHAIAGGMLLMSTADCVLLQRNPRAKYGMPEVMIDLSIDRLMADILALRFSPVHIRRMLYSGQYISQDTLMEWGVVDGICDTEQQLLDAARDYITRIQPHVSSFRRVKPLLTPEWD